MTSKFVDNSDYFKVLDKCFEYDASIDDRGYVINIKAAKIKNSPMAERQLNWGSYKFIEYCRLNLTKQLVKIQPRPYKIIYKGITYEYSNDTLTIEGSPGCSPLVLKWIVETLLPAYLDTLEHFIVKGDIKALETQVLINPGIHEMFEDVTRLQIKQLDLSQSKVETFCDVVFNHPYLIRNGVLGPLANEILFPPNPIELRDEVKENLRQCDVNVNENIKFVKWVDFNKIEWKSNEHIEDKYLSQEEDYVAPYQTTTEQLFPEGCCRI